MDFYDNSDGVCGQMPFETPPRSLGKANIALEELEQAVRTGNAGSEGGGLESRVTEAVFPWIRPALSTRIRKKLRSLI